MADKRKLQGKRSALWLASYVLCFDLQSLANFLVISYVHFRGNWPLPKEGYRRGRDVRRYLAEGICLSCKANEVIFRNMIVMLFSAHWTHSLDDYFYAYFQVHNATNANQKEKYEADLKKEIKKLQVCGNIIALNFELT